MDLEAVAMLLWAKSDPAHPLWCHLLDSAAVCDALLDVFGEVDGLPREWTLYAVAMHDIGKADPRFQAKDPVQAAVLQGEGAPSLDLPVDGFRHEARSADWVLSYFQEHLRWVKYNARVLTAAIRGHHGNFNSCCTNDTDSTWARLREVLAEVVADTLGLGEAQQPKEFEHASSTGVKLTGFTILSDWIASNEELYLYRELDTHAPPKKYWQQAKQQAVEAVQRLAFDSGPVDGTVPSFRDVWPDILELRPSQQALETVCREGVPPGLAIIEAPMGEGKTEAAVFLAEYWRACCGSSGTYLALPTMATSNQMHGRYSKFLEKRRPGMGLPRLVHGMSWLIDDLSPEGRSQIDGDDPAGEDLAAREWFRPSKRALLVPEGVGTVDQALTAALNVKHGFLRLLGLSSKVLVIDEVHAYDEYMTTILQRLLQWCRVLRIPVIMLSATLSSRQKRKLIEAYGGAVPEGAGEDPYPLLTFVPLDNSSIRLVPVASTANKTIYLQQHPGLLTNARETAQMAFDSVKAGGCACVLVNTVNHAQAVYSELQELMPGDEMFLFHARYPAWRRSEIEQQIIGMFGRGGKRPRRTVLVATQVVEQSLDLDFDVMLSQLAPVDLLLQRVGRLWRHESTPRQGITQPTLHILTPNAGELAFGDSEGIYGRAALLRTLAILEDHQCFNLPQDFRPLIELCYGGSFPDSKVISQEEMQQAAREWEEKCAGDADQARTYLLPAPDPKVFSLAQESAGFDESDERSDSYFQASTRLGDRTRSVLLLEDPDLLDATRRQTSPTRDILKELFLHKVDIPKWWLDNAQAADGYEPPHQGARWLRQTTVIAMRNGVWRGVRNGKPFTISFDEVKGVEMAS